MTEDDGTWGSGNATCDAMGHEERETYRDDEFIYYVCERCGAELEDGLDVNGRIK